MYIALFFLRTDAIIDSKRMVANQSGLQLGESLSFQDLAPFPVKTEFHEISSSHEIS
jgi:hypothetical protein